MKTPGRDGMVVVMSDGFQCRGFDRVGGVVSEGYIYAAVCIMQKRMLGGVIASCLDVARKAWDV